MPGYPPNILFIRRISEAELDKAIEEVMLRGYRLLDRGKYRDDYIKSSKVVHWAKMEREKATP